MSNDGNKPLNFWDLQEGDLQEWRDHPVTSFLLQALRADMDDGLKSCAEHASVGQVGQAANDAGRAWEAERYIKGIVNRRHQTPEPDTTDTTLVDRATRISQRMRPANG